MNSAIHRTTYKYYTGVSSEIDSDIWLLNPDLSSVSSVPQIYWKVVGDTVVEMTDGEKILKDQLIAIQNRSDNDYEKVITIKPDQGHYKRIYIFSCDFAKKETWYLESLKFDETLVADGISTTFDLTQGSGIGSAIIDLKHGKVAEEGLIVDPSGGNYDFAVSITGVLRNESLAFTSDGDYEVDYKGGQLTFYKAPSSGLEIDVSYWHSPSGHGPLIQAGPPPGKKWIIDSAEAQFSEDIVINDTFCQNVFLDYPVYNASGVLLYIVPDRKAGPDVQYKTAGQFLDFTYGSLPIVPPFGGPVRGMSNGTILLRWDYAATIELLSSMSMKFKAWTIHSRGYSGERATVTIYGVETDE